MIERGRRTVGPAWRTGALVLVACLLFPAWATEGRAQQPSDTLAASARASDSLRALQEVSILEARRDRNENLVPDRAGDTVLVRGRASVQSGVLPDSNLVFMEDETAGIAVQLPENSSVRRGDSLKVGGVIRHQFGLTRLHATSVARLGTMTRNPAPTPLTVSAARSETYEGQLVQIRGRVVANRSNDGGRFLLIEDRTQDAQARLAVFVPSRRLDEISLDGFTAGDRITVTGVLSQYDYSAPYNEYYQVLPRSSDDLSGAGLMSTYYQTVIILFIAGALLALIAVFTLRAAVTRRTEQLAESRARFRRLAEATFEGIIIHEDDKILDVNRALTQMIGWDREELVGRSFLDVISESTRTLEREEEPAGPDEPYETVVVRKDGSSFPAEIEEKVVEGQDRQVRVAAIRDITTRKRWEQELLRAKEEAEQMARLKSSLLNNMSHEVRTPITSIIGYAELILSESEADHESFARRIRQSGRRLSRTLRSVLEMAQVESGTLDVQPVDVEVPFLVREVVEDHRPMAQRKDLALEVNAATPEESLYTDPTLVRRALANLVHNAIKFTEDGGVQVHVESVDPGLQITVEDTGIGIGADFHGHLFEPFKQESEGRARTHEGTGLGLALTKRMVDLLGGTIEVESVRDEGTTVAVELPLAIPSEQQNGREEMKEQ